MDDDQCPSFNYETREIARKAMESYAGILQKAFEHYQNLWEDYTKLQEKYGQYNAKTKTETTSQQLNKVQESNNISLLELNTLNTSSIHFNSDTATGTSPSDASEFSHKDNRPESPVFSKTFLRTGGNPAKKFMQRSSEVYNNSASESSDIKMHNSIEKVSSKNNHKLELSTTHHVKTTILPDGKRLKQSRLAFFPRVKSKEMKTLPISVDKHKPASMLHNGEQNFIEKISVANAIANTTITEENCLSTNNINEISEDVIEISPTQRNVTSKVKRCLKFKKKIPKKYTIQISPSKNKCSPDNSPDPSAVPEIVDIDFGLCLSPQHTFVQMKDADKFLNTAVSTLKNKVNIDYLSPVKMHNETNIQINKSIETRKKDQLLIKNEVQNLENTNDFSFEDETFYLPSAANENDIDNLYLNDTENKPPEKKILDKFNVLRKRKADVSEQFNMQCKTDRAKLNGLDCWECRKYYQNLSLSKEELQKRMNQCSRHRYKYERPNTPEGFWDPEFPETLSCTYRPK